MSCMHGLTVRLDVRTYVRGGDCGSSIVFAVKNGAVIGAKGSEQRTTYHKGGKGRIQHADEVKPAS